MLPRYAVALPQDSLLQQAPPFDFPGVTMRVFPLRADMTRAQALVDGWLNDLLPPEVAYFRVFSPYVLLVALNYGRGSIIPSNLGWGSQKEITVSIPLQWYRLGKHGYEFHDSAVLTPFIFVDNDLSIASGREVFGWQKSLIWMNSLGDRWMTNPRAPMKHAGISAQAFREVYAGKQQQPIPFVEIDEGPVGAWVQYPPDVRNPMLPWVALNNSISAAVELSNDLVNLLAGLGLTRRRDPLRHGRRKKMWLDPSPTSIVKMVQGVLSAVDPYSPDMYANEINLKQFRDAERPTTACYQDINCTVMRIKDINRMGLLGEARILAGDVTGGYRITLHQWESLPITDLLGLECKRSTDTDGATVAAVKPILPLWADIDFGYAEDRRVLAWRSKDRPWSSSRGTAVPSLKRSQPPGDPSRSSKAPVEIPYNTSLGSTSPVMYGPFETPKATIRVLPLLATPDKLRELVGRALNDPLRDVEISDVEGAPGSGFSFEPWGSYVYFVLTTADTKYSIDNNVGSWASANASFVIPVRRFTGGKLDGFALYSPFMFSAAQQDASGSSEINGMRVMSARIDSPSSTWMQERGPAPGRSHDLMVLQTMIPPILNAGERIMTRTLLKVSQRSAEGPVEREERINHGWAPAIKRDLLGRPLAANGPPGAARQKERPSDMTIARAHAIDYLASGKPLHFLALKQFRDVARPDRACYQALVDVQQHLSHIECVEEITRPLEVVLFDYASIPIAEMLGLVHRSTGYERGLRYRKFDAIRPFWGLCTLHESLGKNLAEQERSFLWTRREAPAATRSPADEGAAEAEMLNNLTRLDLGDPRHMETSVTIERDKLPAIPAGEAAALVSGPEAVRPLEAISAVEPQWVIEAMLSREWEDHIGPVWVHHRRRIEHEIQQACSKYKAFTERSYHEVQAMRAQRRKIPDRHHGDILEIIDGRLLPRFAYLAMLNAEAMHLTELKHDEAAAKAHAPPAVRSPANTPPTGMAIHHFSDAPAAQGGAAALDVDSLYAGSAFGELGKEDAELVQRAESAALKDVEEGGLLNELIQLAGDAGAGVIDAYNAKRRGEAPRGAAPPPARGAGTRGNEARMDAFTHFGPEEQFGISGDEEDSAFGDFMPPPATIPPQTLGLLPRGLKDALDTREAGTISMLRSLVFLAWDRANNDSGKKEATWTRFLETAAKQESEARTALITALAKCWQKPFFCVRRDTAGSAAIATELFPDKDCWPDRSGVAWYAPPVQGEPPPKGAE